MHVLTPHAYTHARAHVRTHSSCLHGFFIEHLWQVKKVDACRLRLRAELSDNDAHLKVCASVQGFGLKVYSLGLRV